MNSHTIPKKIHKRFPKDSQKIPKRFSEDSLKILRISLEYSIPSHNRKKNHLVVNGVKHFHVVVTARSGSLHIDPVELHTDNLLRTNRDGVFTFQIVTVVTWVVGTYNDTT